MSEKQRLEKTGKFHFPLQFTLPASFTELGETVDELRKAIRTCNGLWVLCFLGINFDLREGKMRMHFSLFPQGISDVDGEIHSIEMCISDGGMDIIYPVEYFDPTITEMMMNIFISYVTESQEKIKAGRHE